MREHTIVDYTSFISTYLPDMNMSESQKLFQTLREVAMQNNVTIITATQVIHGTPAHPVLTFHKLRTLKLY
jgi:uncharacterized protein YeaO (DUF488 family)